MSSLFVREKIEEFIGLEFPLEKLVDLTADFEELQDILDEAGVPNSEGWLGIQYVGSEEEAVDITASNTQGTFREYGIIYVHVVEISATNCFRPILVRAEAIRQKFRNRRIANDILIESVSPCNFGGGISLDFQGGYTSGTIEISYQREFTLH